MDKLRIPSPSSILRFCVGTAGVLLVSYMGLIAVVMSYAALTVSFAQSMKTDESAVAALEATYLTKTADIQKVDFLAAGYAKPQAEIFVPAASVTALR